MARRRSAGTGSIKQLANGAWKARLPQGKDAKGKARFAYRTFATKRAGDDWLATMNGVGTSRKLTFAKLAAYWLKRKREQVDAGKLAVATYETYMRALDNHLVPRLGSMVVADVRPIHIERALRSPDPQGDTFDEQVDTFKRWKAQEAGKRYRPVGRASAMKWRSVLHNVFALALRDDLVKSNPVANAERQSGSTSEVRQRGLTSDEFTAILKAAKGTPGEAFIVLALATGARPSELLALRWCDLDLDRNRVRITASLGRLKVGGPLVRKDTKTAKGSRTIPVPANALNPLREFDRREPEAYVFATSSGGPIDIRNLAQRWLAPVAKTAGVPRITLYTLRHAHATMLMRSNTSNVVAAARLGHTSTKLFEAVYAHAEDDLQRRASDAIANMFEG